MRFCGPQTEFYCGVNLHARTMHGQAQYMKAVHGGKAKNDRQTGEAYPVAWQGLSREIARGAQKRAGHWQDPGLHRRRSFLFRENG